MRVVGEDEGVRGEGPQVGVVGEGEVVRLR